MEDRKARLAALAVKAGRSSNGGTNHDEDDPAVATITEQQQQQDRDDEKDSYRNQPDDNTALKKRKIHFRNYIPSDPTLMTDHNVTIATATTNEIKTQPQPNIDSITTPTTKSPLQLALEKARSEIFNTTVKNKSELISKGTNNEHLKNHKINADLKRSIQSKLQLLEKRTQKALVSILRERLEQEATVQSSTTTMTNNHKSSSSNDLD